MEAVSTPQAPSRASWTFADLASTYRFWALMVATMAVTFGALAINLALQWLPDLRELAKHGHTLYTSTQIIAGVAGVALGLLLAHSRTVAGLMTAIAVSAVIFGALAAYGEDAGLGLICLAGFVSHAVATASSFAVFVYCRAAQPTGSRSLARSRWRPPRLPWPTRSAEPYPPC
ncbi:hypothetical protein [Pseudomonas aeruginosa]|uniref:hypothetical protein n=1 Tax=Pseudomonas aeruginosa TaxID=287 RepID=UPI00163ACFD0|nr:hypothetical protein [Pseudomonas aeruginosa]MBK1492749.1 hypothetical protein [Pseudomonas aeruginosa]